MSSEEEEIAPIKGTTKKSNKTIKFEGKGGGNSDRRVVKSRETSISRSYNPNYFNHPLFWIKDVRDLAEYIERHVLAFPKGVIVELSCSWRNNKLCNEENSATDVKKAFNIKARDYSLLLDLRREVKASKMVI
ncbi:hypothetical protein F0562_018288 [Nyssa sinensis]|uniref:Methyltransferase n=1 Tax=Nyssa sinensis TaxID=561372 RepID=A0A5J4Z8N0_9ASTE|nr:hypothetical protein F0562_018288 [Nyssa sinensis]